MERALIIGATGMLGHKALQVFSDGFEVAGTVRGAPQDYCAVPFFRDRCLIGGVDADAPQSVAQAIEEWRPAVVLNCAAVTADRVTESGRAAAIRINSALPHEIAAACGRAGAYCLHISTDGVFSGAIGDYRETDMPDPVDFYGRTKWLGEVDAPGTLTVRTSIFGRRTSGQGGLVEWLRSERGGRVSGYENAFFSGLPTISLCKLLREIAAAHRGLEGVLHVGAPRISKLELIRQIDRAMGLGLEIEPSAEPRNDRSLNCELLFARTGMPVPDWTTLIDDFRADMLDYDG